MTQTRLIPRTISSQNPSQPQKHLPLVFHSTLQPYKLRTRLTYLPTTAPYLPRSSKSQPRSTDHRHLHPNTHARSTGICTLPEQNECTTGNVAEIHISRNAASLLTLTDRNRTDDTRATVGAPATRMNEASLFGSKDNTNPAPRTHTITHEMSHALPIQIIDTTQTRTLGTNHAETVLSHRAEMVTVAIALLLFHRLAIHRLQPWQHEPIIPHQSRY